MKMDQPLPCFKCSYCLDILKKEYLPVLLVDFRMVFPEKTDFRAAVDGICLGSLHIPTLCCFDQKVILSFYFWRICDDKNNRVSASKR